MKNLDEYLEVYFDVVEFIIYRLEFGDDNSLVVRTFNEEGRGGLNELAKQWTDILMRDIRDDDNYNYLESVEGFLNDKDNEK